MVKTVSQNICVLFTPKKSISKDVLNEKNEFSGHGSIEIFQCEGRAAFTA